MTPASVMVGGLCFVYGSLRAGLGNHRVIEGNERKEDGVLPSGFRMRSLGGFPAIFKTDKEHETPIKVEVYEVKDNVHAQRLDSLEGYPLFYNREVVTLEDGRQGWIYFIESEVGYVNNELVVDGDWYKFIKGG